MNYFELAGKFWEEHERARFNCGATMLYFRLLHEANRKFWHGPLTLSWSYLGRVLGMSPSTLGRAISDLKSRGMITYERRGRRAEFWFPDHYQNRSERIDHFKNRSENGSVNGSERGSEYKKKKTIRQEDIKRGEYSPRKIANLYETHFKKKVPPNVFEMIEERLLENKSLDWDGFLRFAAKSDLPPFHLFSRKHFYKLLEEYERKKAIESAVRRAEGGRVGKVIWIGDLRRSGS
jgi:DNA-binding transcriptional ArsR family regulator